MREPKRGRRSRLPGMPWPLFHVNVPGPTAILLLLLAGTMFFLTGCREPAVESETFGSSGQGTPVSDPKESRAENVILFIGDGMGEVHLQAARWLKHGRGGKLAIDGMPSRGRANTASANSVVTDSAAAATAMATGIRTFNRIVGMDPDHNRLKTILEHARSRGRAVGLVTTAQIYHATPASFAAHSPSRDLHSLIAEQMLHRQVDVLLGGGENAFLPDDETGCHPEPGTRRDDVSLVERAVAKGYTHVCNGDDLEAIDTAETSRLLGLFADEGMLRPFSPSLPEMTAKAIAILSRDPEGFFLMVEGGQIDWASHDNDAGNAIADTLEFDSAVSVALDFSARVPETLIIVTADHETGGMSLSLERGEDGPFTMPDGTPFFVNWTTGDHTPTPVPVTARGPGSEMVGEIRDHTDIFDLMSRVMR